MKSSIWILSTMFLSAAVIVSCSADENITSSFAEEPEEAERTPDGFKLEQVSPNPFRSATLIRFSVDKTTHVKLILDSRVIFSELVEGPAIHYFVYNVDESFEPGGYWLLMEANYRFQVMHVTILPKDG